jgi:hypothetical protein
MLLKIVDQSRYVNSDHIDIYIVAGSGSSWIINGYLATSNGFASSGGLVQLSLAFETQAEAEAALDKLAARVAKVVDVATL